MAQRISIGFQASPPLALRVSDEELNKLHDALGGEGWHDLDGEDGAVRLNLHTSSGCGSSATSPASASGSPRRASRRSRTPAGDERDEGAHAARRALPPR